MSLGFEKRGAFLGIEGVYHANWEDMREHSRGRFTELEWVRNTGA